MDQLGKKTFTTSRTLTYTYYIQKADADKPALLLQHGFPDQHTLWEKVLPYLIGLNHTIIVPDLLGYAGTSKPADVQLYNCKGMSDDLAEILDHERIKHVVSVGHDWGAFLASRLPWYHPDRVTGLIILNVAYRAPSEIDIDKTNQFFEQTTGLPRFAYQEFFTSPGARELIEDHLDAFYDALFGSDEGTKSWMEDILCHRGALENFLREDKRRPVKDFAQAPAFKERFLASFKSGGFTGPLNWYHAFRDNVHWDVEKTVPEERLRLNFPVLFIGASKDPVTMTQAIYAPGVDELLPDLTVKEVNSGHWQTYEVPDETGPIMASWIKERASDILSSRT